MLHMTGRRVEDRSSTSQIGYLRPQPPRFKRHTQTLLRFITWTQQRVLKLMWSSMWRDGSEILFAVATETSNWRLVQSPSEERENSTSTFVERTKDRQKGFDRNRWLESVTVRGRCVGPGSPLLREQGKFSEGFRVDLSPVNSQKWINSSHLFRVPLRRVNLANPGKTAPDSHTLEPRSSSQCGRETLSHCVCPPSVHGRKSWLSWVAAHPVSVCLPDCLGVSWLPEGKVPAM